MVELTLAFIAMVFIFLAMSVGAILVNKPIKGSCGGIAALGLDTSCDICGGDTSKCDSETPAPENKKQGLAYEASS
jgi:uncharacterized protein